MKAKLCVIIPTYGAFEYAVKAIESCFKYTKDVFVVVIDDASPGWPDPKVLPVPLAILSNQHPSATAFVHFDENGGLTRSWNCGLRVSRDCGAEYAVCTNSDVLFTNGWDKALTFWLNNGYAMVGPVSNAPGVTARGAQEVTEFYKNYRLTDDPDYLDNVAAYLQQHHLQSIRETAINGFFLMAHTTAWWSGAFDNEHVFRPSNERTSRGYKNPTPMMTLNEDEIQSRWHKLGRKIGAVPGSFIFHYRSVTRGDRYKKGKWFRMPDRGST